MKMPVSLIITTYNNTVPLERCLKSVTAQTVMPDEIVIGDDGSTEETKALIDAWREKISAPIVHVWQEDKGFRASRIRNLSFAKAKYDYLIIIDGDTCKFGERPEDFKQVTDMIDAKLYGLFPME